VSNAIGAWLQEYPVTTERVLRALGKGDSVPKRREFKETCEVEG